jgi:hypothetical protein
MASVCEEGCGLMMLRERASDWTVKALSALLIVLLVMVLSRRAREEPVARYATPPPSCDPENKSKREERERREREKREREKKRRTHEERKIRRKRYIASECFCC